METLRPQETLDEGLVKSGMDDASNPCNEVIKEVSEMGDARNSCNDVLKEVYEVAACAGECTGGPVSPSLGQKKNDFDEVSVGVTKFAGSVEKLGENFSISFSQTQNDSDEIPVEISEFADSVEKLTEPMSVSLGQTQSHCDEIPVEVPEFASSAEKYAELVPPTQNPCDAMLVEVPEFSISVEKLTDQVLPSLGQTQNHCDEIPLENSELAGSADKCTGSVSPLLDDIQNLSDAMLVEVSELPVSVGKLMDQVSPSLCEMQNHYDEVPVENSQFAASAEMNTEPVLPSLDELQNEIPEFTVSVENLTEQVSPSLGEQQNPSDEIPEFSVSVSVENLTEQVSPSLGEQQNRSDEIPEFSVSVEKFTEQMSPLAGSVEDNAREVDYDNKVELPRSGISLFVELNDSVPGGISIDLGKSVLPENSLSNGSLLQASGNLSIDIGNEVEGKDEEFRLNVDDLVWAKTKAQLWLPGIIYDPLNAPKEARKTEPTNCLLVKCFGNASFVWCLPSQLKPFIEFFEPMSKQIISKSFFGALEKATAEIGRRVKMEMTCPCYSNGMEDKRGNFGEFSVTQFEPATFVARIKSLALDVSGHDKIECVCIQNQLTAFFRSIGHCQVPLHQLKPVNEGKDTARASEGTVSEKKDEELTRIFGEDPNIGKKKRSSKSSKSFSLENGDRGSDGKSGRERKKSRYLSYPYVDIKLGRKGFEEDEIEEPKEVSPVGIQSMGSPSSVKSDAKKSLRKGSKKGTPGNDASGKAVEIILSPVEVLSELRHVAIDCLYPRGSKQFDVAENCILGYRKMEFQDYYSELAGERAVEQEFDHEVLPSQTLAEVQSHSDQEMTNSIGVAGENQEQQPLLNVLPQKRGRRKKEKLSDSKTFPTPILPRFEVPSDKGMLNSVYTVGNDLVKQPLGNTVSKKRGRKKMEKIFESSPILPYPTNAPMTLDFQNVTNQGLQEIEVMPSIGNSTILKFEDSQFVGPPLGKLQPKRRKKMEGDASDMAKLDSGLQEVQVMGPSMVQIIPDLNNKGVKEPASFHLNFEAQTYYTDIAGQSQMGILSPCSGTETKKRKKKEKASDLQNNVAPAVPDLNGIGSDGKPQKKRRKRIFKAEACIDYSKLQNNGEVSGPSLLLKFAAGEPVPTKEALVSAFSGFGPLKELETRPLDNSDIAVVVFEGNSNALNAFRSLEKNSPFGPALVNFQLHNFSGEASKGMEGNNNNKIPSGKLSGQQKEAQNLPGIRKNLEMMTSMLKKSGPNLSPEMRAKLEREVNGLLEKVSEMVANSSS